ncbi:hypothetical protein E05_46430 [Plautia stali symbiont]|nr:hypothetical protein E05_46430 [Plautia stali symbiont]
MQRAVGPLLAAEPDAVFAAGQLNFRRFQRLRQRRQLPAELNQLAIAIFPLMKIGKLLRQAGFGNQVTKRMGGKQG